jgi:hypothetical protein
MQSRSVVSFAWLNLLVVIFCLAAVITARPALAVNDCSDPAYAAAIDPRVGAGGCVEVARIPIPHRGGVAFMRILCTTDLEVDARANNVIAWLRVVAARTGQAMDELGAVDIDDVSILLTPFDVDDLGVADVDATAHWPNSEFPGQCLVAMYLGSFGDELTAEALQFTMAHELFHCVQFKTWDHGPSTATAFWWVEGSAEYFAALAFPEIDGARSSIEDFDANSRTQSLLSMQYEDLVLFSWVDTRAGPSGVKYALDVLAEARTLAAARGAAERAFGRDNLLSFAQDYIDGAINLPRGRALNASPRIPTQGADVPLHLEGEPFVLVRAQVNYEAGDYRNAIEGDDGRYAAAHQARAWAALPTSLNLECDDDKEYTFAALSTADPGVDITITPSRLSEHTCAPCGAEASERLSHNSCLVGAWHFPGHRDFCATFAARLGSAGATVLECNPGTGEVTFGADGAAVARVTGEMVRVQMNSDMQMHIVHELTESRANWSTDHGELAFCNANTTMTGMTTITGGGASRQAPINVSTPMMSGGASYNCTRTTLTVTSHDAPGAFLGVGPEIVLQRVH